MGDTFLGRAEPHNVRRTEIDMLGGYLNVESGEPFTINLPYHIAMQMTRAVDASSLVMGGLVTRIAVRVARFSESRTLILLPSSETADDKLLSLDHLIDLRWVRLIGSKYHWTIDGKLSVVLLSTSLPCLVPLPQPLEGRPRPPRPSYLLPFTTPATPNVPSVTYSRRPDPGQSSSSAAPPAGNEELMEMMRGLCLDVRTMQTDIRLALHPIYSHYASQGVIQPQGPHPSWFQWLEGGFCAPRVGFAGSSDAAPSSYGGAGSYGGVRHSDFHDYGGYVLGDGGDPDDACEGYYGSD
ncbi:hypothetical protein RND81_13G102900 [Saponaria officinalis]|uniref:Uncharacterized protein n=1 Tax=Saponaria officinalis TaxID=3572 RepID=A0AAW1GYY7_SAPOF